MPTEEMVSCICPTYNRAPNYMHLLQEVVYWFMRQEYDKRELIILNDCPGQTLSCRVTGVRVINVDCKIATLGEKFNRLIEEAEGKIILPWEDDDISLPHRIPQSVGKLQGFDYWNPQRSWYETSGKVVKDHNHGVCHNASAFRKDCGVRYAECSGPQDAIMDARLKLKAKWNRIDLKHPAEWSYVYRWGVSNYHLSGFGTGKMEAAYKAKQQIAEGKYEIQPVMYKDYYNICKELSQ
jgi:glycosyltransferase involved in cell wall biosynthesis